MGKQHKNGQGHPPAGTIILSREEIQKLVRYLAQKIQDDYAGKEPVLLAVLKGAFVFMADLSRELTLPLTCDFIRVSSYGPDGTAGPLRLDFDVTQPVKGKDVLVLEDVVDSGKTLGFIRAHLLAQGAKSVRFGALVQKAHSRGEISVDYVGKIIPNDYVVGYGMDLDGRYRNLPWIQSLPLTKS